MASVLHGSARTTPRMRAELQASRKGARSLAARYDLNPKTVRKWRRRTTTADAPMGPKARRKSTVLTPAEENHRGGVPPEDAVAAGRRAGLPGPQSQPEGALHRCLQRHGISRLPKEEASDKRSRFKSYQIGYVHIDSCEPRHTDGKPVVFLAIDQMYRNSPTSSSTTAPEKEGGKLF